MQCKNCDHQKICDEMYNNIIKQKEKQKKKKIGNLNQIHMPENLRCQNVSK